ncbi:MAG: hypothetical protein GF349_01490, partial [Candidatus Magasanikbacteria bacterium]|nr:hypothetical protein [Candidatus Magasanikbacteria bacterium]
MQRPTNPKKTLLMMVTSVFIFVQMFGLLLVPTPAKAQMAVTVIESIPDKTNYVLEIIERTLYASALYALVNGASYFARRVAYDTASWIAHGGKGQSALAFQAGFDTYLARTLGDSTASVIGDMFKGAGLNLCRPPDANVERYLQVSLSAYYDEFGPGPEPSCTWQELTTNWNPDAIRAKYGDAKLEDVFINSISFKESDFGIALGAMAKIDRLRASAYEADLLERLEGDGFKSVKSLISGDIKTPSDVVEEEAGTLTAKEQTRFTIDQISGIYGSSAKEILPMAASVFLNTLVSQLLNQIMSEGILPGRGSSGGVSSYFAEGVSRNRQLAEAAFSFLLTTPPAQLSQFDIVNEFASCPSQTSPKLNNCVIDTNFQKVIERARTGDPLTIGEALEQGILPDRPIISPRREVDNTDTNCYLTGYCYSNIQKLRKARILPLGFEIAALMADPDNPQEWTLKKVVDGFHDCETDLITNNPVPNAGKPFCGLIDPNWIIKAPETICSAYVYGPQPVSDQGPERLQECVDFKSCVSQNSDGSCEAYGYCTKEKNVWKMPGAACEEEYATCETYRAQDGRYESYLTRTVDYGDCTADDVGCRAYSAYQDEDGWLSSVEADVSAKVLGVNQNIYFNNNINQQSCLAEDEGCSALRLIIDGEEFDRPIYLKKAPSYLGCYDTNLATPQIEWPVDSSDLAQLSDNPSCNNFAQVCVEDEVGCDSYIPNEGGSSVAGIIGNNFCAEDCVGYDTFKQEETDFAPSEFPLYFIAGDGQECSEVYAGCDEFTNIDELSRGGEGLEYYSSLKYCEVPEGNNEKIFYTWEGSAAEGYVLRTHNLKPDDDGSPIYADDSPEALADNDAVCNEEVYNNLINNLDPFEFDVADADCRAFYDDDGAIYYKLLAKTVSISEACHPLRKTESRMFVDNSIVLSNVCEDEKGGNWNTESGQCERCYSGGVYQNGSCVYKTITEESNSCPAAANGCRAYLGNEGNRLQQVAYFDFEPVGDDPGNLGWDTGTVVAESIQVGSNSLQIDGDTGLVFEAGEIKSGGWYELSFWARGTPQNLQIQFDQDGTQGSFTLDPSINSEIPVSISQDWREYKLGPVQFMGTEDSSVKIFFDATPIGGASGPYFMDNLSVVQAPDLFYRIKDSWKRSVDFNGFPARADVPLTCDADPTDGRPGSALGCATYTSETTNQTVNITGFDRLCRDNAVGCQPFLDTFNTLDTEDASAYNVWCQYAENTADVTVQSTCEMQVGASTYECTVNVNNTGCYIDRVIIPSGEDLPAGSIVSSTVYIPADTDFDIPIYLTYRPKEFGCSESNLGCKKFGAEEQVLPTEEPDSFRHQDTYLKDNPSNYDNILCRDDLVGCGEFSAEDEVKYFKDPELAGNKICEYRSQAIEGEPYGWYIKGVGRCVNETGGLEDKICVDDSQCGEGFSCQDMGEVPCYENYIKPGGEYGIWSNRSLAYGGFVGSCPETANKCTEFIDPTDTSGGMYENGTPYYLIYDNNVQALQSECEGSVSRKYGCALFDKTDEPNKFYHATSTYIESESKNH